MAATLAWQNLGRIMDSSQTNTVASVLRIHRRHQDTSTSADEPVDRLVDAVQRASSWSRVIVAVSDLISFIECHISLSIGHSMMPQIFLLAKQFLLDQNLIMEGLRTKAW